MCVCVVQTVNPFLIITSSSSVTYLHERVPVVEIRLNQPTLWRRYMPMHIRRLTTNRDCSCFFSSEFLSSTRYLKPFCGSKRWTSDRSCSTTMQPVSVFIGTIFRTFDTSLAGEPVRAVVRTTHHEWSFRSTIFYNQQQYL